MSKNLAKIAEQLIELDTFMVQAENDFDTLLKKIHPKNKKCAINLLHYLALRSRDIRDLQDQLHANGLSSMASSESHVRGQLQSILKRIGITRQTNEGVFSYETSKLSLLKKLSDLFGYR
jgi:pyruvate kinase